MAEAGPRVPAWKRLGLALKNEAQSGVAAPEPAVAQKHVRAPSPYDNLHGSHESSASSIVAAASGKPSNLGKRKLQYDTVEDHVQTAKRGRTAAVESSAQVNLGFHAPPSETTRAKGGDSNYRKKKDKPQKSKRRSHEKAPAPSAAVQPEVKHASSFLSPEVVAPVPVKPQRTLLASTETDEQTLAPALTLHRHREAGKSIRKESSGSPSAIDRRKSVTFTPDTKKLDGSSGQDLFKHWVSEQKGVHLNFDYVDPGDPVPAAVVEEAKDSTGKDQRIRKEKPKSSAADTAASASHRAAAAATELEAPGSGPATTAVSRKGKKKDPALYTSYLDQYHSDRGNWKFSKAKQNDVVDNALNIFRIPQKHSEALLEYVQGLKGAGVVERLKGRCTSALREIEEEEAKEATKEMSAEDAAARKKAYDEALKTRVSKEQKRRKVEGDAEALATHPHGDGYIRRLRRERAEALLTALSRTAPILPAAPANGINPMLKHVAPARDSRKRKRRGDISSDDSSSDSSSEEESSSSGSEADSDDSDSDSSSSSSEESASESGSEDESSGSDDSD
ncbi:hypothetical protein ACEQ8H_000628 [Pleosporales sp. CAS-2024a]